MSVHKPKRILTVFLVMALVGTNLEMATRWLEHDLEGFKGLRFASAAGWSSLWMLGVYGAAGAALGLINQTRLARQPMVVQCLIAIPISLGLELPVGYLLNIVLGLRVWDYSEDVIRFGNTVVPLHFRGQVSLVGAVRFFLTAPFAFWVDDLIRFVVYDEPRPNSLAHYYKSVFRGRAAFEGSRFPDDGAGALGVLEDTITAVEEIDRQLHQQRSDPRALPSPALRPGRRRAR